MAISFSAEANLRAVAPYGGADPTLIFTDSKTPVGFKTVLGVTATSRVAGVTSGSATVTVTDTTGIAVGNYVGGAGVSGRASCNYSRFWRYLYD